MGKSEACGSHFYRRWKERWRADSIGLHYSSQVVKSKCEDWKGYKYKNRFGGKKWNSFKYRRKNYLWLRNLKGDRKRSRRKIRNREKRAENGNGRNSFSILSWNSGSTHLQNQMNEIKALVQDKKPHVLFIQESNLWRHHNREGVELDGYDLFTSKMISNPDRKVSRIVAYVMDGIIARRREDLELEHFSAIWLEVGLPHQRKFLVAGVYREWAHLQSDNQVGVQQGTKQDQEERWRDFLDVWEDALDTTEDVTVLGDINIDLNKVNVERNHRCRKMADDLRDRIESRGVKQLVLQNTRYSASADPSLLDHIYVSKPELFDHKVTRWGTSDHRVLEVKKHVRGTLPQPRRVRKRVFKNFKQADFIKDIKNLKWWPELYGEEDLDRAVDVWERKFVQVLDKHCPVKSVEIRRNYTPWLTQEIKKEQQELSEKQRIVEQDWTREKQKELDKKAKNLRRKIRGAEEKWMAKEAKEIKKDGAKTWKKVKSWLGWKTTSHPEQLKDSKNGGKLSRSSLRNCTIMNEFYINKVAGIKQNMPRVDGDPCAELRKMMEGRNSVFSLTSVTQDDVRKTAGRMRKTTSMGRDDVPADLFFIALPFMLPAVTHILNLSLIQSTFPSKWKISKICPLHKGGDKNEPKQFRPVALLPIMGRLLEKIVCDQVMKYLQENDLFHSQNHGYRKGHGITSAVIEAQLAALDAIEDGEIVGMVTLDQSAAFDVVDHFILKEKMKLYGFDEHAIQWFEAYLHRRRQYVALQSSKSIEIEVGQYACPQGSGLGPLLWNLFCGEAAEILSLNGKEDEDRTQEIGGRREVCNKTRTGKLIQYADDIMFLIRRRSVEEVKLAISGAYGILSDWFLKSKLKLNSDKTHFMYLVSPQKAGTLDLTGSVDVGGDQIKPSDKERILGVTLGSRMSMRHQLMEGEDCIMQQVSRKMRGLWQLKNKLTFKARKATAWGLVMSRLMFSIEVWGPSATESQVKSMQVCQNQIMRFVCGARRGTRTEDLLRMTGMLSIKQLICYRVLMTGLGYIQRGKPLNIVQSLKPRTDGPRTRGQTTILAVVNEGSSDLVKRSFKYKFLKLAEDFPRSWLERGDPQKFKVEVKDWVKTHIEAT